MSLAIYSIIILSYFIALPPLFEKAGRKKWEGFVPVYNLFIWMKVLQRPWWWVFLLLFPGVNVLMLIIMNVNTAIVFNQRERSDYLMAIFIPFIYLPMIAFKKDVQHVGRIPKEQQKKSAVREWGDAILFAIIAASIIRTYFLEAFTIPTSSMEKSMLIGDFLFVSKIHYGPKVPQTPLSFPFAHHTLPLTKSTKSYLEWMHLPYMRLPGLIDIERNDVVVFNFPAGDTVIVDEQERAYEQIVRDYAMNIQQNDAATGAEPKSYEEYINKARRIVKSTREITVRPVDKRENYIKRCVGMPGDKLQVDNGILWINEERAYTPPEFQYNYFIKAKNRIAPQMLKENYDVNLQDIHPLPMGENLYMMPLTLESYKEVSNLASIAEIRPTIAEKERNDPTNRIFPNHPKFNWTEDFFGEFTIPKEGETVQLTVNNLPLYERIINVYEDNDLKVDNGKIFINGHEENHYTFKMNYYFLMGDNRHNSADSRFWGLVPEDHVVGKAVFIWFSTDKEKSFFKGIRWNRLFTLVE